MTGGRDVTGGRQTYLVGYDGSTGARDALRWALDEARRTGAGVWLVYVFEWLPTGLWVGPGPGPGPALVPDPQARAAVAAVVRDARAEAEASHPGVPVRADVLDGPAKLRLIEASAEADLVVVGSRGPGAFMELLIGSTAQTVSAHARCPVVVVHQHPGVARGPVVVGVDGSPSSLAALRFAFVRATAAGRPLRVLQVRPGRPGTGPDTPGAGSAEVAAADRAELAELLAGWPQRYPGVELTAEVVTGHPAKVLVAESREAYLVVVGSRGRGGFRGLLLGSVSQQLLHHAQAPVAVVREAPADRVSRGD
jgi:nucleotide-binding universal stress UspA family protein